VDSEQIVVVGDEAKLESLLPSLTLRYGRREDWGRREVWGQASGTGRGVSVRRVWDNNILISSITHVTFSGHTSTPVASPSTFTIPNGGSQVFTLEVHDDLNNPLVGGSTISLFFDEDDVDEEIATINPASFTVPDGHSFNQLVDGLTRFTFIVSDGNPSATLPTPLPLSVTVRVTSPNDNVTTIVATGTIQ